MKRRHLLLVALSLILSICMCFCLAACDSCNDETEPVQLATPVVTVDADGVARWSAIENASGYAYKISNGEEKNTDATSVTLTDGQSIAVKAVGDGVNFTDSGYSEAKTYTKPAQPVKLGTPTVTINDNGLATWAAVPNASGYMVKIGDTETEQTELSKQLTDGQSIQVKAVGNGTTFTTGDYSAVQTYEQSTPPQPEKLGTPEVDIDADGLATWVAIPNASGYMVKIDDTETEQSELTKQLTDGQSIQVKALGNGTEYVDGDYSTAKTYEQGTVTPQPEKLGTPVVVIDTNGLASWQAITNASGYMVKIGDTETRQTELTKQLTDGQSIQVKALGNGTEYVDGDYSAAKTYEQGTVTPQPEKLMAPTVEVDDSGLASWRAIEHATKYVYKINDGKETETTATSVQLSKGQKIIVKAIGDGENYLDSNFSAARAYIDSKLAASLSFADVANRTSQNSDLQIWTQNGITFTNEKAKSSTAVSDNFNPVRLYKDSTIKVEFEGMVKIVFHCNTTGYATALNSSFTRTSITHSVDGKDVTVKFNVQVDLFDVEELSAQVRIDSIDVYVERIAVPLDAPVVTIDADGNASWAAIEHATGYKYAINGGEPVSTDNTSVPLLDNNATIKVYAVGDGIDWANSAYSEEKTYVWQTVQLDPPAITINKAGVVSWEAVEHAVKYVYVITTNGVDGEEQETTECKLEEALQDGQSIKIKTIGERRYLSSDFGDAETYTAPTEASQLNKDLIEITIARDGTVTVTHPNASSFTYKIGDGEEKPLALDGSFELTSGQSVTVKAVGDGTIYTDSEYTDSVTYTAPQQLAVPEEVTIAFEGTEAGKVVVSWNAVEGASGYAYSINDGEPVETQDNSVTIALAEADSFKVKAIGDDNTATDGNFGAFYNDSEYCTAVEFVIDNEKTYTVAEILNITVYYGTKGSTKTFIVSGVVSASTYNSTKNTYEIWLKNGDVEKAFELYGANLDASITEDFKAADALKDFTVTASGKTKIYNNTKEFDNGCTVNSATISNAERVAFAKNALKLNETYSNNFELPLTGKYGATISWAIANEDDVSMSIEIDTDGKSVTILQGENDVQITLTATITYGEGDNMATDTKDITFTIPAEGNEPIISWVKVTSADDLKAGDIIIFTYIKDSSTGFAMSSFSSGIYNKVDLSFTDGTPDLTKEGIVTITLIATDDAAYPFALLGSDGKYIASSNTKNKCAQSDTITDNCKWKFNSTTLPTKLTAKTGTYNIFQYNPSQPRFCCYGNSGQMDLTIYKQVIT